MSRVIVKNLPKHATEDRLREHFAAVGEVTDCRLKRTKDGVSRQFAFVGFRKDIDAKEAIKRFSQTFFDTGKIIVEAAHAPGSENLARPWSRYAPGSTAHSKKYPGQHGGDVAQQPGSAFEGTVNVFRGKSARKQGEAAQANVLSTKQQAVKPAEGQRSVKVSAVEPSMAKAGVALRRVHVEFASSDEENHDPTRGAMSSAPPMRELEDTKRLGGVAFDEGLSDLAYLKKKVTRSLPDDEAAPNVIKKKKRIARKHTADTVNDSERTNEAKSSHGRPPTAAGAEGKDATEVPMSDRDELESSGRLFVTNIPYGATEDELHAHFEPLGEVASVHLCKDEDTLKSRGFGYVSYVFPECAIRALSDLTLKAFQGRLLQITSARAKPLTESTPASGTSGGAQKSSYKRRLAEKKKSEALMQHTWNLLYVSANAAADAAAAELGLSKGDLFGKDSQGAAVTAALTETSIIQQTKRWLQKEGIRVDAFERSGSSLSSSQLVGEGKDERREDAIIVKHLPAGSSLQELRERFARHGELIRCTLAPSGTVAVVQFAETGQAKRAFQKLAFSRYRHVPLYLEWAPVDMFSGAPPPVAESNDADDRDGEEVTKSTTREDELEQTNGCLFVKNLNFSTTEATLKSAFASCRGFRSAVVMKKKAVLNKGGKDVGKESLSMGYGFLEFDTAANSMEVLKRRQGMVLDGHAVQLQLSQGRAGGQQVGRSAAAKKVGARKGVSTTRLCVRNLAFEATQKELRSLFSAYGSVTAVRIPKKGDYSGHRGFAFIDFASKSEAATAFEALQHTHLYGRRMAIEPAEEKASDVDTAQQEAKKRQASKALKSEAKRRRRAGVLNTTGAAKGFADALDV